MNKKLFLRSQYSKLQLYNDKYRNKRNKKKLFHNQINLE